jgi:hypothetical protein
MGKIWDFHSGDDVTSSLLECYATSLGGEWFPLFRGIEVPPSSPVTDLKKIVVTWT